MSADATGPAADTLATAQLLLAVLAAAKACGLATWADLARWQKDPSWLAASRGSV